MYSLLRTQISNIQISKCQKKKHECNPFVENVEIEIGI